MGVGMVIVVSKNELDAITTYLSKIQEDFYFLGEIKKDSEGVVLCHR